MKLTMNNLSVIFFFFWYFLKICNQDLLYRNKTRILNNGSQICTFQVFLLLNYVYIFSGIIFFIIKIYYKFHITQIWKLNSQKYNHAVQHSSWRTDFKSLFISDVVFYHSTVMCNLWSNESKIPVKNIQNGQYT